MEEMETPHSFFSSLQVTLYIGETSTTFSATRRTMQRLLWMDHKQTRCMVLTKMSGEVLVSIWWERHAQIVGASSGYSTSLWRESCKTNNMASPSSNKHCGSIFLFFFVSLDECLHFGKESFRTNERKFFSIDVFTFFSIFWVLLVSTLGLCDAWSIRCAVVHWVKYT